VPRAVGVALAGALAFALAGCELLGLGATGVPVRPAIIIVRGFEAPEGVVVLDPSFGFSLHRGAPGVPRTERAAAVARAASFAVDDAIVQSLRAAGLDAAIASEAAPNPDAVTVRGVFTAIDQGRRRSVGRVGPGEGASRVVADARLDGPGGRQWLAFHADSDRIEAQEGSSPTVQVKGTRLAVADANRDGKRVGQAIGQAIIDFARRSGWLQPGP